MIAVLLLTPALALQVQHAKPAARQVAVQAAAQRRAILAGGAASFFATAVNAYTLPDLPYAYEALEPSIDAATMKFHHDKHHATYISGVNTALEGKEQPPLADLQKSAITGGVKGVRNSGGGAYNHDLFWKAMAPKGQGGAPSAALAAAIDAGFGSMDSFKEKWAAAAAPGARFGSGWVWLIVKDDKVKLTSTNNQDNPLMDGLTDGEQGIPVLGLDVWEHAYYLKYQNRRPEYVAAFWDVVNWNQVNAWYADALKGKAPQF
ncbi:Manganese/iron superoxide dismutase [Pelagophyceae sp. CCMP2097]|nr:Manganese/iron superoxide dismutase [Pelagophyceae sp. CCMP2097]|mmetsp:Transcript_9528/g.31494  ORF Transcript_9528/g.31494 Transcript_9528/m.31494 type:complete len:262 (-) Transcript_9528:156-941(-)